MSRLSRAEQIEVVLIPLTGLLIWLMVELLPRQLGIGSLLLSVSALLLGQGLIRDLWSLYGANSQPNNAQPVAARCLCAESTLGSGGVIIGLLLFGSGINAPVFMSDWLWSLGVAGVLSIGFLIKDYVLEFGPLRIRKEKDHRNVIFTWRPSK